MPYLKVPTFMSRFWTSLKLFGGAQSLRATYLSINQQALRSVITIVFVALSLVSTAYSFYLSPSFSNDSAALGLNLVTKEYYELFFSLDHYQVAPIAFLLMQKFLLNIISDSDYALTLLSFVCFVCSIPVFYKLTRDLTKDKQVAQLAVALFCWSPMLLNYAVINKQYMVDVLVVLLLFYGLISNQACLRKQLCVVMFGGAAAICFSYASLLCLPSLGLYLLYTYRSDNKALLKICLSGVALILCVLGESG
jgi:hypothetical protein